MLVLAVVTDTTTMDIIQLFQFILTEYIGVRQNGWLSFEVQRMLRRLNLYCSEYHIISTDAEQLE